MANGVSVAGTGVGVWVGFEVGVVNFAAGEV